MRLLTKMHFCEQSSLSMNIDRVALALTFTLAILADALGRHVLDDVLDFVLCPWNIIYGS